MIGEPELDAAWETDHAARPAEELAPREREAGGPGARRPWLWALGGAAIASAVWAGGLYALGDRLAAPELSYRATENLCQDFEARALSKIGGNLHRYRPMNQQNDHPAVRGAICVLQDGETTSTLRVRAQVDLHKKTDPAAEFDVPSLWLAAEIGAGRTEAVQGLGERAVLLVAPGDAVVQLKVLDGGAVFTIEAFGTGSTGNTPADTAALQAAMVEDARALLAALKK
ncbi:hypothetical protein OHA91_14365 [Streptomyces erythrochromogenes]|uniref:Uncharacterized protein n=1 Tax=Streptomyces erythrochromogenes TaxID=285574 RepID=A0ABZ1QA67_9ACTN|nr:hypothetical protein [Streptomyces erythrochromogenes]